MSKRYKVATVPKSEALNYFKKAKEFRDLAELAMENESWNAVGLNAVHCVISAADAMLVKHAGMRSSSMDHSATRDLLIKHVPLADIKKQSEAFRRIITKKNVIEYESQLFYEKDAVDIIKKADRFFIWAENEFNRS